MTKTFKLLFLSAFFFLLATSFCQAAPRQVLKGEATGKVFLGGEPWGTGKVTFTNISGDASFVVTCEKDISAGANSASCKGTDVDGFFSGGPNGYAVFGSGSSLITLQLVDGKKFTYAQGGVTAELEVADPSIFNNWDAVDEDEVQFEPEEYDPNAPLTDSGARAADIDGQVEIACPPDFDAWDVLKPGRVIYNHCRLKTGEDSTLRISFGTMSSFVMRPETEVIINEATKEKSNFQLLFGGIWANVKKMARGEEFGFKGSQAVAGIKGTTFVMEETGEETTLKVIEGEVAFTDNAKGETEAVRAGEALTADAKGLGEKNNFDISAEEKNWNTSALENKNEETKAEPAQKPKNYLGWIIGAGALIAVLAVGMAVRRKKRS